MSSAGQKVFVGLVLLMLSSIAIFYKPTTLQPVSEQQKSNEIQEITSQLDEQSSRPFEIELTVDENVVDDNTDVDAKKDLGEERADAVGSNLRNSPWIYYPEREKNKPPVVQRRMKYVSVYGAEYEYGEDIPYGTGPFVNCRYTMCSFLKDHSKADAIFFIARIYRAHPIQKMWYRPPHQRWVFKTADAVLHDFHLDNDTLRSAFNWTSFYRPDCDIFRPMGMLQPEPNPIDRDFVQIFRHKKKFAAWFVSHCNTWSRREEYVRRMRQLASVDVFGDCGKLKCGGEIPGQGKRDQDKQECLPMLERDYKFYLSFENGFCNSYITEKFFKLYGQLDIIPVVRGGLDYNNFLPKGTFVNAADFKSPEELTKYLIRLANDEDAYVQMLREKNKWRRHGSEVWCKLCEKLHTDTKEKHYEDLRKYLMGKPGECWSPQDLGPELAQADIWEVINSTLNRKRPWPKEWWN